MKAVLYGLGLLTTALAASQPANDVVLELSPTAETPRNSEGAFTELDDGRILFCYSQYFGGDSDHSAARVAAIESKDGGRTWSAPRVVVAHDRTAGLNVMSVSLVKLGPDRVLLFYLFTKSAEDCRPFLCESVNQGATWTAPRLLVPDPAYLILNNDRVIRLRTGRLIMPMNQHARAGERGEAIWLLSDDDARTWRRSASRWGVAQGRSGLQESGVVENGDGSLLTWMRTDLGSQFVSRSFDQGSTWTEPRASALISPLSPASIKRLPDTQDLLVIYNDHSGRFPFVAGQRTPLVAAISHDGGATWPDRRLVEGDVSQWYHYTAIHFTKEAVLLAYNAGTDRMAKLSSSLRLRRVSFSWLPRKGQP